MLFRNLCQLFMNVIVHINILQLLLLSNKSLSYKCSSIRLSSFSAGIESPIFLKSSTRIVFFTLQKWWWRKQYVELLVSMLQEHEGFNLSLKLCLRLSFRNLLKLTRSLARTLSLSLILQIFTRDTRPNEFHLKIYEIYVHNQNLGFQDRVCSSH